MKRTFVLGGSGFLGSHLCARLKADGAHVTAVSRHYPAYDFRPADEYWVKDLTLPFEFPPTDEIEAVYQLAGEVGGLGYIQNPVHDFDIMERSTRININTIEACRKAEVPRIFFASSACVYPDLSVFPENAEYDILDSRFIKPNPGFTPEWSAYPAEPINAFGWEKLYAERLWEAYGRKTGAAVRIGRLGNTYGPYCAWEGDRAKVIASLCRKVSSVSYAGQFAIWGDGRQVRSFTYVDDAVEGIVRLMASDCDIPLNIASDEAVTISELCSRITAVAGKIVAWTHEPGPVGVRGRVSCNALIREKLGWEPSISLREGLKKTYPWVKEQVDKARQKDTITS